MSPLNVTRSIRPTFLVFRFSQSGQHDPCLSKKVVHLRDGDEFIQAHQKHAVVVSSSLLEALHGLCALSRSFREKKNAVIVQPRQNVRFEDVSRFAILAHETTSKRIIRVGRSLLSRRHAQCISKLFLQRFDRLLSPLALPSHLCTFWSRFSAALLRDFFALEVEKENGKYGVKKSLKMCTQRGVCFLLYALRVKQKKTRCVFSLCSAERKG